MRWPAPVATTLVLGLASTAWAHGAGVTGYSQAGCQGCHGGGAAPTVVLAGPTQVPEGSTAAYTLTISGGVGGGAGLDVSCDGGVLDLATGDGPAEKMAAGEITNSSVGPMTGTSITYTFHVTAGIGSGFTLYAAGLSGSSQGASADAETQLFVQISHSADAGTLHIAQASAANPNPVLGTTALLSVQGTDSSGAAVSCVWSTRVAPDGGSVSFLNANTCTPTATFTAAGTYVLTAALGSTGGTTTSAVTVTVIPTLAALDLSQNPAQLQPGATVGLTARGLDQFGRSLTAVNATWTATGDGTVDSTGQFTAGNQEGTATLTATSATLVQSDVITISRSAPAVSNALGPGNGCFAQGGCAAAGGGLSPALLLLAWLGVASKRGDSKGERTTAVAETDDASAT